MTTTTDSTIPRWLNAEGVGFDPTIPEEAAALNDEAVALLRNAHDLLGRVYALQERVHAITEGPEIPDGIAEELYELSGVERVWEALAALELVVQNPAGIPGPAMLRSLRERFDWIDWARAGEPVDQESLIRAGVRIGRGEEV